MQSGFCTNCGQPLAAGAAFCPSCGTPIAAAPAAAAPTANSVPPGAPPYAPAASPAPAFAPAVSPQGAPPAQKSQARALVGWVVGCLGAFLVVVALLVALLVIGLLTHKLIFFGIGLGGLLLMLLVGVIIEHQIRRLYRRAKYGIEGAVGLGDRSLGERPGYRGSARPYHQQPSFSLVRFIFSLLIIGAAIYGGLYLYYSQEFSGAWSGVLTIGGVQQGVQTDLPMSLALHGPTNPSFSDLPSLTFTQVQFKPVTATACKGSPTTYQLSGTASRLDASTVAMTLDDAGTSIQLRGSYNNDTNIFTLSGTSAQGKAITLTLQKGSDQAGYLAACK